MRALFLVCVLALFPPARVSAVITESFDSLSDGAYGDLFDFGEWVSNDARIATDATKARGGTGRCLVFDDDEGAYLLYEGADGAGKDGGLGTVSIWYRHWNGDANSVRFQAEYSQSDGPWIPIGSEVTASLTNYTQFSVDVNVPGDDIQVRFHSTAFAERLCLDDVSLGDFAGPPEDPNLVSSATLAFGEVSPGTNATQMLALANSGATLTLHLTSLLPVSGDTSNFSVGSLPATLAPGATDWVSVVYSPGNVTGATHSAVFNLTTDDPTTPNYTITFSGQTIGSVSTISNVQYSLTGPSLLNSNRVIVTGIATYADPSGYALSDPGGGPWSGIYVTDTYHRPALGDRVRLGALVQESSLMTVLTAVSNYLTLDTGWSVPVTPIHGNELTTEAYEGVLVSVTNVIVKNTNYSNGNTYWQAGDSYGNFLVASRARYRYVWHLNDVLDAIQGIVYVQNTTTSISPRYDADMLGRPVYKYALRGLVMTPDGPRTNWYVQIEDDVIVAVTNVQPSGVTVLDTGGIIYPGLIDVHNHPSYNSFPTLMFNDYPFGHRDQWGIGNAEYTDWKNQRTIIRTNPAVSDSATDTITKYGECLELMAGCIAIQGQSDTDREHSYPGIILFNIEQFPARTWSDIFPWTSSAGERATVLARIAGGAVNASMIHLCEGTDATALAQFYTWRNWGMLNETTAIIHGAALGASEFAEMAAVNAKLIWSPMSNMRLYGGTANVKAARDAGVLVGLSPDWTPSGCYNILEELGYAWELNQTMFSNAFTPREMCDMVTINNARCAGLGDHYGKIQVGYNAGLVVIEGDIGNPYMSLINARPPTVLLTIVDGTPRYGEPSMMAALGASGETVDVRGRTKCFNVAMSHPFLQYSDRTFTQLRSALQTAHSTLSPVGELDSDELQFLDLNLLQGSAGDDIASFQSDNPISSGPGTGTYDKGSNLFLSFRYQDFWDNNTFITNLTHTISIVPTLYPNLVLQTIAVNWPNTPSSQTVPFTVGFQDMHTNYTFVFLTTDGQGNQRTSTMSSTTFNLAVHTGGDSDGDGMPNEWEIVWFGNFTNGVASGNNDGDELNNLEEYITDTNPTNFNSSSSLTAVIDAIGPSPVGVMQMQSFTPTSTNRVYDVWWTTNLVGNVVWQPVGLNVPGKADGAPVTLRVTNTLPAAFYRTGVKLPE